VTVRRASDMPENIIHPSDCHVAAPGGGSRRQGTFAHLLLYAILAFVGLCGIVVVLLSTSRYGVGTLADSAHYIATARSLLAGTGYRSYASSVQEERGYRSDMSAPYTQWPPLFPTLLAAIGLAGVDPQVGARWLNAIAFGLIVFLSGELFARYTTSKVLVVTGAVAVLTSSPLVDFAVMALSEPVFIVLVLLVGLSLPGFLRDRRRSGLVLVSVLVGLACLQRYAGVCLIPAVGILIGISALRYRPLQGLIYLLIFGVLSTAPTALWCLRNHAVAWAPVGGHQPHPISAAALIGPFEAGARVVTTWLFPWTRLGAIRPVYAALVLVLAGAAIVCSRTIRAGPRQPADGGGRDARGLQIASTTFIALVFFGFTVVCGAGLVWRPEQRHLSPIYPFCLAFLIAGLEGVHRLLPPRVARPVLVALVLVVLGALWLQSPVRALWRNTVYRMQDGAGGFITTAWEDSPMMAWLRRHPLPGWVFSNVPGGVYMLAGIPAETTPFAEWRSARFAEQVAALEHAYVVWSYHRKTSALLDERELASRYKLEEMMAFPDGSIYRVYGITRPQPWVEAIYRFWSPATGCHFYTIDRQKRDELMNDFSRTWVYENTPFYAFSTAQSGTCPVYHFQSSRSPAHFYTMNETEKDRLLRESTGAWTYAGVAFYAFADKQAEDLVPVYRLWSPKRRSHFYTANERERERLVKSGPHQWTEEGIAWYAYGPPH
jgi:hypothetical protein